MDKNKWITLEELVESKVFPVTIRSLRTILAKRDKNGITKHFKKVGNKWLTTIAEFSEWLKTTEGDAKYKYPERVYNKRRGRPPKYYRASMISIEDQKRKEDNFLFLKRLRIKQKFPYSNLNNTVPYHKMDTFLVDPPEEILNREGLDRVKNVLKASVRDYTQYKPIHRSKKLFMNLSTTLEEILNEDPFCCDTFRRIRKINQAGRSSHKSSRIAKKIQKEEDEKRSTQAFQTQAQSLIEIFKPQGNNESTNETQI